MNDAYKKLYESIAESLTELSNMIVSLAMRTLSVKDYQDFVDEFTKKKTNKKEALFNDLSQKRS